MKQVSISKRDLFSGYGNSERKKELKKKVE